MRGVGVICLLLAAILLIVGIVNLHSAFDKKDNYSYSNRYVGGDAYNYIINAGYFTGYCVLGCTSFICCAIITALGIFLLRPVSEIATPEGAVSQRYDESIPEI